jgi:hypothetical protein
MVIVVKIKIGLKKILVKRVDSGSDATLPVLPLAGLSVDGIS